MYDKSALFIRELQRNESIFVISHRFNACGYQSAFYTIFLIIVDQYESYVECYYLIRNTMKSNFARKENNPFWKWYNKPETSDDGGHSEEF